MSLAKLQTDFQDILLNTECMGADWVSDSVQGLSAEKRMGIYYNAYRIRLIDTLIDTFEHTASYLGDRWFNELAANYVQLNYSIHNNIGLYGKNFPRHLVEQLPGDGEVAELALLDWTLRRAFDGANAVVTTQDDLQRLMLVEGGIDRLLPVPTLSINRHCFNTLDIWHAINQDNVPPVVEKLADPVDILIWRKGYSPHFRSLSPIESVAITYFCDGCSFDEIGEALGADFPEIEVAAEFGAIIARWLEDELLTRKSLEPVA